MTTIPVRRVLFHEITKDAVQNAILAEYNHLGGAKSQLGTCTTSELPTADGIGRYNHFEHGSIYWSPSTHAHAVQGAIQGTWGALGWEQKLG